MLEWIHHRRGWPLHYPCINDMPYDVAVVFCRMLYSDENEEEAADIMGELATTLDKVRQQYP